MVLKQNFQPVAHQKLLKIEKGSFIFFKTHIDYTLLKQSRYMIRIRIILAKKIFCKKQQKFIFKTIECELFLEI